MALLQPPNDAYLAMPLELKAWHIIAETQRAAGEANSRPHMEYFVVAIAEPHRALQSLRRACPTLIST
jgi:hypothetical protein